MLRGIASLCFCLLISPASGAQEPPRQAVPAQPSAAAVPAQLPAAERQAPARAPGVRHHDGFYLRLAAGVTYLRDSFESTSDTGFLFGESKGSVTGFGQAEEIAVGGAVAPGLILAGVAVVDIARTTKTDYTGAEVSPDDNYVLATFGPMVDFYPDPNAGLHLELGGGLGVVSGIQPEGVDGGSGTGFGLFAGVGQEWWIADQWALGGLLRLQYVSARESYWELLFDELRVDHRAWSLSLMLSATYN